MRRRPTLVATTAAVATIVSTVARPVAAQEVERLQPFDGERGHVEAITPALVQRLDLTGAAWPVRGEFREARLYASSAGGWVLVVQRPDGALERQRLTTDERALLHDAVVQAVATRTPAGGDPSSLVVSEPVRNDFIARQGTLGLLLYGPAVGVLVSSDNGDGAALGAAAYLLTAGASFFGAGAYAYSHQVTRAQSDLASSAAVQGALVASGLTFAAGGKGREFAAATLGGALAGTTLGVHFGRPMTDGESHATSYGATFAAATTAGLMGATGGFAHDCVTETRYVYPPPGYIPQPAGTYRNCSNDLSRGQAAGIVAAGLAGYPLGLLYPRRASYTVTGGDVDALSTTGLIGVAAAAATVPEDASAKAKFAAATTGLLLGTLAGDRLLVRRYDHTPGEARTVWLGAAFGGLVALAPTAGSDPDARVVYGLLAAGGAAGVALTEHLIEPRRGTRRLASSDRREPGRVSLDPTAAATLLARRGAARVMSVRF